MEHPQYEKIRAQLRSGTSVPALVSWFEKEGWLGTMSPSTFNQYLYKFKSEAAHLLEGAPKQEQNYDFHVGTRMPAVDAKMEIDKLIMVQRRRISIDFNTEVSIGKLLDNTHKEIKTLGELLAIKVTMEGRTEDEAMAANVGAELRNLRVNEAEQDRMQELANDLFSAIKSRQPNANKAKKKKTVKA